MKNSKNFVIFIWLAVCTLSVSLLAKYSVNAGPVGTTLNSLPVISKIHFDAKLPNLLVFLHPNCACSQATVSELERLLTYTQGKMSVHVVFAKNREENEKIENNSLWKRIRAMDQNIDMVVDEKETESSLFGAETSGQTYLYDESGSLVFAGGLTIGRGHEGDSPGRETILNWVNDRSVFQTTSPVFGCLIKKRNELNL